MLANIFGVVRLRTNRSKLCRVKGRTVVVIFGKRLWFAPSKILCWWLGIRNAYESARLGIELKTFERASVGKIDLNFGGGI